MRKVFGLLQCAILLIVIFPGFDSSHHALAQDSPFLLTPQIKEQVILEAARHLEDYHVIPEIGQKMSDSIRESWQNGSYEDISDARKFGFAVSDTMFDVDNDGHVWLNFYAEAIPLDYSGDHENVSPEQLAEEEDYRKRRNFGFERVERLRGNIGYIDYRSFSDDVSSESALAATMELLKNTGGLIIDLRQNGGGSPDMVTLFLSYLIDDRNELIGSFVNREGIQTDEFRTRDELAGPRYGAMRPVYLLNSSNTFSAAEAFSYYLQSRRRARVIGETTKGGARPNNLYRLHEHFMVAVPVARSVDPLTNSDWEETGIVPDYEMPADETLLFAHKLLLQELLRGTGDSPARRERELVLRGLEQDKQDERR